MSESKSENEYEAPEFRPIEERVKDAWFLNRMLASILRQANDQVGDMDKKIKELEHELRSLKIVHDNDRMRIEDLRRKLHAYDGGEKQDDNTT